MRVHHSLKDWRAVRAGPHVVQPLSGVVVLTRLRLRQRDQAR